MGVIENMIHGRLGLYFWLVLTYGQLESSLSVHAVVSYMSLWSGLGRHCVRTKERGKVDR